LIEGINDKAQRQRQSMTEGRTVRSANGPIPWHTNEDQGYTIHVIKDWRATQDTAGRPNGLDDFYAAHGLCFDCSSRGAVMVGWSDPTNEIELKAAEELGSSQLPLWAVCQTCGGSGKAERSRWSSHHRH
jgi:hypothetical protein